MTTALIVALAVYAALMTYLRATAHRTKTTVDDKLLEIGEKVEPIVILIQDRVDSKPEVKTPDAK